jgi:penicillin-insensitive murein endopeptidase
VSRALSNSLATFAVSLVASGCFGTPTPLAPNLSGSVGVPHHGVLTESRELPKSGRGFVRYRPHGAHYFGNPRLVAAIEEAAAIVAAELPGGAPLVIGDLSARRGGQIPGHRSHRTGRDVDLLLYVTTPAGASVSSPGFVHVSSDGLAKVDGRADEYVRLDVERQWLLVKHLLLSEHVAVQFLFVSRDIEALLVDYALARGEDLDVIWHAQTVMLEPGDSTPHDDHIHMRVACTPEEAVSGCEGGGPHWQWLPDRPTLTPLDEAGLIEIARDDPLEPAIAAERAVQTPPQTGGGGA